MTERQKIILAIVSALAVVGLLVALLLPLTQRQQES